MKSIDFFSGIGGFHSGLERAGMACVGWCEFDKFAQASYRAMYNTDNLWFGSDVTKVKGKDLPKADLWAFGFPCQDISIAGNQKGIKKGTRSGLFYEIMRLLDECEENKGFGGNPQSGRVYSVSGVSPTINTCGGGNLEVKVLIKNATKTGYLEAKVGDGIDLAYPDSETRRGRVQPQQFNTLTTSDNLGVLVDDESIRIRKLTPKEYWRLQGFSDEQFEKAAAINSNSQLYKQAGNAVTVNVVEEIGRHIMGVVNEETCKSK